MLKQHKAQGGYKPKLFLIDHFYVDATPVQVYVFRCKRSIKQYCTDTETPFKDVYKKND